MCHPPRGGLDSLLVQVGHTGPLAEPRRGPQAGKSGDPHSQSADSSPRAQRGLGLGFEAKPKGKCGAPRAPTASALEHLVARLNSSRDVHSSSWMASSSFILMSRMPSENAQMMASSVHLGDLETRVVKAVDVLLQGLSRLWLDAAQVTRGRGAVASALEDCDEVVAHLI